MSAELTSVAYKKGNPLRYSLWGLAVLCIILLFSTFFNVMSGEASPSVPEGYKFSVTDNYNEGDDLRTVYYVYDNRILVEDESSNDGELNRVVMVYDDINTTSLSLNADDTTEICQFGACHTYPKVLAVIKKLISRKNGREYLGV